jgi:hypothetical protein
MIGIRSPDELVVGSCTSHPGVLGPIPKREEPGKTGRHPVLSTGFLTGPSHRQVPGSSQPNRRALLCLGEIWVSDCMLQQRLHARLLPLRIRILHTH